MPWLLRPGEKRNGRPPLEDLPTHFFQLAQRYTSERAVRQHQNLRLHPAAVSAARTLASRLENSIKFRDVLGNRGGATMKVGYRVGLEHDDARRDWFDTGARPLAWSAWYPCPPEASASGPAGQFFDPGDVRVDADVVGDGALPVVLMSHGTGGSAESIGWLARRLARAGHIVIGAQHHGNTAGERFSPAGFLCWWERASDLSILLTILAERGPFAGRMDLERVAAVGFSLGAHTVLALAGAVTSMERYSQWASGFPAVRNGPREMPDAARHIPELMQASEPFRSAWARQSVSFLDRRIRAVTAIAPPPPVRGFDPATVAAIETPVLLIAAGADTEAPSSEGADWLMQRNARFGRMEVRSPAGHYTFLGLPAAPEGDGDAPLFRDPARVSRADVHDAVASRTIAFLTRSA